MEPIEIPVTEVLAFTDRARVTRSGRVQLNPADPRIVIGGLAASVDHDSVRISGMGPGIRMVGVQIRSAYDTERPAALGQLEAAVATAKRHLAVAVDNLESAKSTVQVVAAFEAAAARRLSKSLPDQSAVATLRSLTTEISAERARLAELKQDDVASVESARKKLEAAEAALASAQPQGRYRTEIELEFDLQTSGPHSEGDNGSPGTVGVHLELSYIVFEAAWRPVHDVSLANGTLRLDSFALMSQTTGETWDDIRLRLSTARPGIGTVVPTVDPWIIDRARPPQVMRSAKMPMTPRMMAPMAAGAEMGEATIEMHADATFAQAGTVDAPMVFESAEVEHNTAATTYVVTLPTTIPPDGTDRRVPLGGDDLPATIDRVCAPHLSTDVTIRAVAVNGPNVVLAGEASIFHEGEYVGRTYLDMLAPGEEVELALGTDDRVSVERKLVRRDAGKSLVGSTRKVSAVYRTTVTNHSAASIQLEVRDRIPHSVNEDISIKSDGTSPAPTETDEMGVICWKRQLDVGAEATFDLGFVASYPKGTAISGLAI